MFFLEKALYHGNVKSNPLFQFPLLKQNIELLLTTRELVWIHSLLGQFHIYTPLPISLFCNNHAAIQITQNPVFHERTKHLDIDCHVVREKFMAFLLLLLFLQPNSLRIFLLKPCLSQDSRFYYPRWV